MTRPETLHTAAATDVGSPSSVAELAGSMRSLWATLVRRRRDFGTAFLTIFLTVVIAGFLWPGTYVAYSAVLIQKQRLSGGLSAGAERTPTVISSGVTEEEVNSEIAILTSRAVLEKTLVTTGLDRAKPSIWLRILFGPLWLYEDLYAWYHAVPGPTQYDRAMRSLTGNITAERMKDSDVLVVSYTSGSPEFSRIVLEQLLKFYLDHHVEVHSRADVERFFEMQAATLQSDLTLHEDRLQEIKRSAGAADLLAERSVQQKLVASLREERERLERTVAELDQRIASYDTFLKRGSMKFSSTTLDARNDYAIQTLVQERMRLELERVRLIERWAPDSPLLVENERKLAATRAALEGEQSGIVAPAAVSASQDIERTRAERAGYAQRITKLANQIERESVRLRDLDETVVEAKRVERLIATSETQYLQYLRRGVEARIDRALDAGQFTNATVVQEAAAEPRPIRPKKWITLLLGVGGGLIGALGAVVAMELKEAGLEAFLRSVAPRPPSAHGGPPTEAASA